MTSLSTSPPAATAAGGFPGPRLAGIALIAAPLCLVVGAALLIGIYDKAGTEQLEAMADHTARAHAAINFAIAGTVLAALAVAGLAGAVARRRPRAGHIGGSLALVGLFGPGFFLGINYLSIHLADLGDRAGVAAALEDAETTPVIVNLCGPALVIGFIVLAVGAARSGVLSRSRSVAMGLGGLAPFGLISGVIVISIVAWLALAVAWVPLGLRSLRGGLDAAQNAGSED